MIQICRVSIYLSCPFDQRLIFFTTHESNSRLTGRGVYLPSAHKSFVRSKQSFSLRVNIHRLKNRRSSSVLECRFICLVHSSRDSSSSRPMKAIHDWLEEVSASLQHTILLLDPSNHSLSVWISIHSRIEEAVQYCYFSTVWASRDKIPAEGFTDKQLVTSILTTSWVANFR